MCSCPEKNRLITVAGISIFYFVSSSLEEKLPSSDSSEDDCEDDSSESLTAFLFLAAYFFSSNKSILYGFCFLWGCSFWESSGSKEGERLSNINGYCSPAKAEFSSGFNTASLVTYVGLN